MAKLPVLKSHELISALQNAGFSVIRQKGSLARLQHADGRVVTVPIHVGQDIGRGLLRKILRDVDITPDDLLRLL